MRNYSAVLAGWCSGFTSSSSSSRETPLIEEYRTALLELRDPSILRTAGTILASHSQHRVRARLDADLDPLTPEP